MNKICPKKKTLLYQSLQSTKFALKFVDDKIRKLEKISDAVDKLDAHYGFYLLKNCFNKPKLLSVLRTNPHYFSNLFLEWLPQNTKKLVMQVKNVKMNDNCFLQAALLTVKSGLKISFASLPALFCILASTEVAKKSVCIFFLLRPDG